MDTMSPVGERGGGEFHTYVLNRAAACGICQYIVALTIYMSTLPSMAYNVDSCLGDLRHILRWQNTRRFASKTVIILSCKSGISDNAGEVTFSFSRNSRDPLSKICILVPLFICRRQGGKWCLILCTLHVHVPQSGPSYIDPRAAQQL